MTVFSSEYHVGEDEIKDTRGYGLAAVLCAVMLIALTVTTFVLGRKNAYEDRYRSEFRAALRRRAL